MHLNRIACGLDSRVVGDAGARDQLVSAAAMAERAGTLGPVLGSLLTQAEATAELVGRRAPLHPSLRSLAQWAVDVGVAAGGRGRRAPRVVVLGYGRLAVAVLHRLHQRGLDVSTAAPTADLAAADLVVCVGRNPAHGLSVSAVAGALDGRDRPLTVVDLGVPRLVDPDVGWLPGVRLLDVDDLHDDEEGRHHLLPRIATAERLVRSRVRAGARAA